MFGKIAQVLGLDINTVMHKVYKTWGHVGVYVSLPCFHLAWACKMPPADIAKKLEEELGGKADGPYYEWFEEGL
jgi:hypothetical protein